MRLQRQVRGETYDHHAGEGGDTVDERE